MLKMTDGIYCSKVQELFASFRGEKSFLIQSVGFGGLLKVPPLHPIDREFTLWLLENFDTTTNSVVLNGSTKSLPFRDLDASLVLGIPYKGEIEPTIEKNCDVTLEIRKLLLIQDDSGPITLDKLEEILRRDHLGGMTKPEQMAFKVAAVLFSSAFWVGSWNVNIDIVVDLMKHLVHPEKIANTNWSNYVVKSIQRAAQQVQNQLHFGCSEITFSCCLHSLVVS